MMIFDELQRVVVQIIILSIIPFIFWLVSYFGKEKLVIAFTGTLGWLMGYINEKADGSILPSWILMGFQIFLLP
jgi:hypothetical protein